MWSLIERAKKVIFALVLSIIPLVLLYVQSKDEEVRNALAWPIVEAAGLVERQTLFITGTVSDWLFRYFYLVDRADELIALRAEVLKTRALKSRIADLIKEGSDIKELCFKSSKNESAKSILARVIGRAGAPMARMIRLDKGSSDGVKPKAPVMIQQGVIGQVISASFHFSDVLLITDASFALEARIVESNVRGLLRGITSSTDYRMEIRDIDGLSEVKPGDNVVTSGINSYFPSGIPIGTVLESFRSRDGLYVSAKIEPFVQMEQLVSVLVLEINDGDMSRVDPLMAAWPMAVQ